MQRFFGWYKYSISHTQMKERIQRYFWFKGRASAHSGKVPKFGSKCRHRCEKVWHFFFVLQRFFLSFFFFFLFCQLSLFLTITSFCRVSLTLALLAPNFAHALTMSLPPLSCLHKSKGMRTYLVLCLLADVLSCLRLVFQDAQARETHTLLCQD
jgi:hypothetical protein